MTIKIYDKLVRDNIPAILKDSKVKYKVIVCPPELEVTYITKKLIEEVQELVNAMMLDPEDPTPILSECADVYSVLIRLAAAYDIDEVDILEFEEQKTEINGGFEENYILKWVDEDISPEEFDEEEEFNIPSPKKPKPLAKKKPVKPTKPKSPKDE